jgi:hypothetical protein
MAEEEINMAEEKRPIFEKAGDYEFDPAAKKFHQTWTKFWEGFEHILGITKENAPPNTNYSVSFRLGEMETKIEYKSSLNGKPVQTGQPARMMPPKSGGGITEALAIVAEYPDMLRWNEEAQFVGTKTNLGSHYKDINERFRGIGFRYVKYNAGVPNTGGWKAG